MLKYAMKLYITKLIYISFYRFLTYELKTQISNEFQA